MLLYAVTVLVAFCSIIYELLMAQCLSATLGSTLLRYSLTVGIYLASLGFGAFLMRNHPNERARRSFVHAEFALVIAGGLGPFIAVMSDHLGKFAYVMDHIWIVLIGILSGLELPLLMKLAEMRRKGTGSRILAADYLGTLIGAISFPFFLLPTFGIFGLGFLAALLNCVAATLVLPPLVSSSPRICWWELAVCCGLLFLSLGLFNYRELAQQFIVSRFYL